MTAATQTLKHYVDTPAIRKRRDAARWLMRVGIAAQGCRVEAAEMIAEQLRAVDRGRRLSFVAADLRDVADWIDAELAALTAGPTAPDVRRAA